MDYGQPVRFGVFVIPEATEKPLQSAVLAEELGFDAVGVQDHPYQRRFRPRMLSIIGRVADGWVPSLGYVKEPDLVEGNRRIDAAAQAAGRDPRGSDEWSTRATSTPRPSFAWSSSAAWTPSLSLRTRCASSWPRSGRG